MVAKQVFKPQVEKYPPETLVTNYTMRTATVVKEITRLNVKTSNFVSPYVEGKLIEKLQTNN